MPRHPEQTVALFATQLALDASAAPPGGVVPTLPALRDYPFLQAVREHGYKIAAVAAVGTFLGLLGMRRSLVEAVVASGAVGVSLAYVHEMTVVVSDTLLPE